ncbi:sensor histidine kinase [Paenibacillus thermotolerans]|uniref:sensor histidine kinase n=1 Tax=Paenibacillus thermotolerans TaxID=3027807 RepID=UPI0023689D37|nr:MULTISPECIES: HAMP domain-containing sensor histidine kinase [unclassified Paenibacillus]
MQTIQTAQNQLVESEKMVALGSLVAGVSHEINTPVGVGVTAASYLEEKTKQFAEIYEQNQMKRSDLEEYMKTVRETASMLLTNLHRASELIRSFKQVAVDRSVDAKRKFQVSGYIKEILTSLQPNLKKTKHRVVVEGDERIELFSDPGALSQIITNLIMNSLIHAYSSDDEGTISIHIREDGRQAVITYADDGKGMPEDVVKRIFEPFFTTNRGKGGTGLGMHIVYNLVTQSLGGTVKVDSALGKGTRFTILIPMHAGGGHE